MSANPDAGPSPFGTEEAERRLSELAGDRGRAVLFIVHAARGGTIRYAKTVAALIARDARVIFGRGIDNRTLLLCADPDRWEDGVSFALPGQLDRLSEFARQAGIIRINVVHAADVEDRLTELLEAFRLPFDLTLTDYHLAATQPHLRGADGIYVGDAAESRLALRRERPAFVGKADRLVACSRSLARSLGDFWPDLTIVAAAPVDPEPPPPRRDGLGGDPVLRVLTIDARAGGKGRAALARVSTIAERRSIPIVFHAVGRGTGLATRKTVVEHDEGTAAVIESVRPHMAWFPFALPETYSFALSDALGAGLPILATAIGAAPERLHGRKRTWLMPAGTSPQEWLGMFRRLIRRDLKMPAVCPEPGELPPALPFYPDLYVRSLDRR